MTRVSPTVVRASRASRSRRLASRVSSSVREATSSISATRCCWYIRCDSSSASRVQTAVATVSRIATEASQDWMVRTYDGSAIGSSQNAVCRRSQMPT